MATAIDLIRSALLLTGAVAADETLSASDAQDGLETLNEMVESWGLQNQLVSLQQDVVSLTGGLNPHTIGLTGDLNVVRPVAILSAQIRTAGGIDFPLHIIGKTDYDDIAGKSDQGIPEVLALLPSMPLSAIYLYPVPDIAYSLVLTSQKPLGTWATLTTDISLPPGYARAIRYNLAIEMAQYGAAVPQLVGQIANESLMSLKIANHRTGTLKQDLATCRPDIMNNRF